MRGEHQAVGNTQDLLDFRRVAMRCHAVSLEILVGEAEMSARRSLLACARHTGNSVYDDWSFVIDKAKTHGRRCSKRGCRGIAAGATDDRPFAFLALLRGGDEIVWEQLGQAEGRRA